MDITRKTEGTTLQIAVKGSINTQTAPEFESALKDAKLSEIKKIIIDLKETDYISSAGLRVLLVTQNQIDDVEGELVIINASESILEVFEMTGFSSILTIE